MALEIAGIENIVIVQNKIDLVSEQRAMESHAEIKRSSKEPSLRTLPSSPFRRTMTSTSTS